MLERINALIDETVTDVLVSASNGVWLQRHGCAERTQLAVVEADVRSLAHRLIDMGGRHIDESTPCADVALADGVRVHAVLAPISVGGTEISIRIPAREPLTLKSMLSNGHLSPPQEAFLREAIRAKLTVLVSGSAGAGKSTLLGALMSTAPETERIITIEDVAELRVVHPRTVSLEVRQPNTEGRGALDMAELIRQSLRMRPERLVVGECRGAEVVDMLRAFTTGHSGGGSTIHANSLADVATRLDSLGALAGLDSPALARLVVAAIDLVVHVDIEEGQRCIRIGRVALKPDGLAVEEIPLPS